MDSIKDKNNQDEKGLISNTSDKKPFVDIIFSENDHFVFIYKKVEKLVTAIYLITNLFGDVEPMKWTLRTKSSDFLSFIINHTIKLSSEQTDFIHLSKTKITELVSLLQISHQSGLVSKMNFSLLESEFYTLIYHFEQGKHFTQKDKIDGLPTTFFDVSVGHSHVEKESISPDIKDNQSIHDNVFKRSNRQNIILGLLRKKKEVSIKDIAHVIKDCSEKTIQRELILFISSGMIQRIGERRWSKYTLV